MTKEDIIRIADEAGFVIDEVAQKHQPNCIFHTHHMVDELLARFAALIISAKVTEYQDRLEWQQRSYEREIQIEVEAEREECAQIADAESSIEGIAQRIAATIRARNNT